MLDVSVNLKLVRDRIQQAEKRFARVPGSVQLIAVSKTKTVELIREAITAEQKVFGESYIQEAVDKIQQLSDIPLHWHFIGPIQSNKTKLIAENFEWVHGVDRLKIAQRLSAQRPDKLPDMNICLQVNVSEESTKAGVALSELPELIESILTLPNINLRGFMAIPNRENDFQEQRKPFKLLSDTLEEMNKLFGLTMDTLSIGMSGDLEAAIAEGATFVRVGTDIFGERDYKKQV